MQNLYEKIEDQKKKYQKLLLNTRAQKVFRLEFNCHMIEMYSFENGCVNKPHLLPQCPTCSTLHIHICTDTDTYARMHTHMLTHMHVHTHVLSPTYSNTILK